MFFLMVFAMLNVSWADKPKDLGVIERVCMSQGVTDLRALKLKKQELPSFCSCVKRNMDTEFSQSGDEKYLNLIAQAVSARTKKEKKAAEDRMDHPDNEGAYVFMDIYLDIRLACAADPSAGGKAGRRPDTVKK